MLEEYLIDCCSPTLAHLKSANLFNCQYSDRTELAQGIEKWNRSFQQYGLRVSILRQTDHSALIYVFRVSALRKILQDPEIMTFLEGFGYPVGASNIFPCLAWLKHRVQHCQEHCGVFPHEIGVFLGYPLYDVVGFISNHGKNCKCLGTWKVYGDVDRAKAAFDKYDKCRDIYTRLWSGGTRSVLQLTVAG